MNKKKIGFIILVIGVISLLVGGIGYTLFNSSNNPNEDSESEKNPVEPNPENPQEKVDCSKTKRIHIQKEKFSYYLSVPDCAKETVKDETFKTYTWENYILEISVVSQAKKDYLDELIKKITSDPLVLDDNDVENKKSSSGLYFNIIGYNTKEKNQVYVLESTYSDAILVMRYEFLEKGSMADTYLNNIMDSVVATE